jgi:putative transposase
MLYVRFPLSLRNVEDLLHERGIEVSHETVRHWWRRFGPMFAAEIRVKRREGMRSVSRWRWHLDEVFVRVNGVQYYLWRAVDHEGEVLEAYVTKRRDKAAALKFLKKLMKRHGQPEEVVTDKLRSYGAALKELSGEDRRVTDRWANNRAENSHQPFRRRERAMLRFRRMHSLQKFAAVHSSVHASAHNHFNAEQVSQAETTTRPTAPPLSPSGGRSAPADGERTCPD